MLDLRRIMAGGQLKLKKWKKKSRNNKSNERTHSEKREQETKKKWN